MERTIFYEQVRDRLIRYARVDTQSARVSDTVPTTKKQFDLAYMLRDELVGIGAADVWLDEEKCVVYGRVPATVEGGKAFGLVTHMDTAPDAPGAGCKPWVLEEYDGGDILLNEEKGIVMSPREFPNLKNYVGQDLILTDGTTLLGGDDKAAIAVVMTMAEHLLRHLELPHGPIALAFTPDEEVGGLARDLDLDRFGAKVAYTLDGDYLGYYEDETFNASHATALFRGRSVHTGTAKGIMVNAGDLAAEFVSLLPPGEKPQFTEGREGFFHLVSIQAAGFGRPNGPEVRPGARQPHHRPHLSEHEGGHRPVPLPHRQFDQGHLPGGAHAPVPSLPGRHGRVRPLPSGATLPQPVRGLRERPRPLRVRAHPLYGEERGDIAASG